MPTADVLFNLGNDNAAKGQINEAIHCYRQALHTNPRHDGAWHNLGSALVLQGKLAEAVGCFRQALQINPNEADTHHMLGKALYSQGQLAEAVICFTQAVRINPNLAVAHNDLGNALFWQGDLENAIANYRLASRISPNLAGAQIDLGSALLWAGQHAEAAGFFQRALDLEPGNGKALWHRAWLRLLQGDYEGGWLDYEHRPALTGPTARSFGQPRWDGADLNGKTILIHAEQGLGDTIQFARYLPLVQRRGGNVIFECQPPLVDLLTGMNGAARVFPGGAPLPPFDVHVPLLSLPGLFGTTLDTIPAHVPYLTRPNRSPLTTHNSPLTKNAVACGSPLNIGIAWQGSMDQKTKKGDRRCLPLFHFEALARVPGIRLYSLQVGPGAQQIANATIPVVDLGSRFDPNSLVDLSATLVNLDLVVTIDSAVAHLAGALGVPVWTMLAFAADWRWLLDRENSPWYPTMRLFRQRKREDWDDVMQSIVAALATFSPGSQNRNG